MRRVYATFGSLAFVFVFALAIGAHAQGSPSPGADPSPTLTATATAPPPFVPPPTPPAPGANLPTVPPAAAPTQTPEAPAVAPDSAPPATPAPTETPVLNPQPGEEQTLPAGASASPAPPTPPPTPVPIIADPPAPSVEPGQIITVRLSGTYGTIVATSANPQIADVAADQDQRVIVITGRAVGTTVITVKDDRVSVTRDVAVRVAFAAGSVASETSIRVTGNPATTTFLREAAASAAQRSATLRPGAVAQIAADSLNVHGNLGVDDRTSIDVPVQLSGDGYIPVSGTTRVDVENFALPHIQPSRLLVSDYPERLTANGVLFTADLDRRDAQRFLYYHYNPASQPSRRILLRVSNSSNQPAMVQFISGSAGPELNEMEVGHLSTQRFLVRELQNEATVVTIPPNATINLVDHPLPPGTIVSALLQLREIDGDPLQLTLVAQDASAPLDQSVDTTQLLSGGVAHARGEYQVPQFYFDYSYEVGDDSLEIPIGQLPLPNLRQGEALAGDYGVQQAVTVTIVNNTAGPAPVAIYANPRGGRATGTFLIDRTLVQAHALPPFSRYKIWQETIAPRTFRRVGIVTMPEGGSSYPLRLVFGQDDGSVAPGAAGSPIY